MKTWTVSATALLLGSLVAASCSPLGPLPDRSRYFTLTAHSAVPTKPDRRERLVYGLGPIVLPAYLQRNQVVTRLSPAEVAYSQWDRWAEPLDANVSSVLRETLSGELGTDDIVPYPWFGIANVDTMMPGCPS